MDKIIPVLSLIVAALAVFVGPIATLSISRREGRASLAIANKQIIAPMRQAWINSLRDTLSDLTSCALHYSVAGYEDRSDAEYLRLTLLDHKLKLMLNPHEEDHRRLEEAVRQMIDALGRGGKEADLAFQEAHAAVIPLSRQILKREWDRVRVDINPN